MSAADLDSLEATLELLADETAMTRVREAEAAVAAGDVTSAEDMADLMRRRRERERRGE
jgi:PHD/YefM family antitoxin component YafN of YafNO toxin-antitoxin module